jgi:hypothetical protein
MPKFSSFLEKARRAGLTITKHDEWSQGKQFANKATFGSGGVCAALSAVWLRFSHDKSEWSKVFNYFESLDGREEVMALSLNYMKAKNNKALTDHLQNFGYRPIAAIGAQGDLKTIEGALKLPGVYLVGFDGQKGGHQIAVDGLCFRVFDPNYGEVKLTNPQDTASFTKNLIKIQYKGFSEQIDYIRLLHLPPVSG